MSWGSDEFRHRSAELTGWCDELREADPADVDDTVPGAAAYAAETATGGAEIDGADGDDGPATVLEAGAAPVCDHCLGEVPETEALDADGEPASEAGFRWLGEFTVYHRECIPKGEGRFLPWTANGVLADEADGE